MLNIFLALFNLVPIPPLDGSKILPRLLPFSLAMKYENFRSTMEQNASMGFLLVIVLFVMFLSEPLSDFTRYLTFLLIGV